MTNALTRACRIINDRVQTQSPIHCGLLELILFEINRFFDKRNKPYLKCLYKAVFALGYYGLLRVGELSRGIHVIKAKNIHLGINKDQILIVLYSSKTHDEGARPQKIKTVASRDEKSRNCVKRHFCLFPLLNNYFVVRGTEYDEDNKQFFIFRDKSPLTPSHTRKMLKDMIQSLGLDSSLYDIHSLRIG